MNKEEDSVQSLSTWQIKMHISGSNKNILTVNGQSYNSKQIQVQVER